LFLGRVSGVRALQLAGAWQPAGVHWNAISCGGRKVFVGPIVIQWVLSDANRFGDELVGAPTPWAHASDIEVAK
jgi:hypothetical protein